jgi:hypothetical protein
MKFFIVFISFMIYSLASFSQNEVQYSKKDSIIRNNSLAKQKKATTENMPRNAKSHYRDNIATDGLPGKTHKIYTEPTSDQILKKISTIKELIAKSNDPKEVINLKKNLSFLENKLSDQTRK